MMTFEEILEESSPRLLRAMANLARGRALKHEEQAEEERTRAGRLEAAATEKEEGRG